MTETDAGLDKYTGRGVILDHGDSCELLEWQLMELANPEPAPDMAFGVFYSRTLRFLRACATLFLWLTKLDSVWLSWFAESAPEWGANQRGRGRRFS